MKNNELDGRWGSGVQAGDLVQCFGKTGIVAAASGYWVRIKFDDGSEIFEDIEDLRSWFDFRVVFRYRG